MLTDQFARPNSFALDSALPCNVNFGAFCSSPRISISFQETSPIPEPSAFATASFAAQRPARDSARFPQYSNSAGVKIRSSQALPCLEIAISMRSISIRSTPVASFILINYLGSCCRYDKPVRVNKLSGCGQHVLSGHFVDQILITLIVIQAQLMTLDVQQCIRHSPIGL